MHTTSQLPAQNFILTDEMKDHWMDNYEFMEILKHLVQEKKDLKKRLDVLEEILHSYLPTIENKKKES